MSTSITPTSLVSAPIPSSAYSAPVPPPTTTSVSAPPIQRTDTDISIVPTESISGYLLPTVPDANVIHVPTSTAAGGDKGKKKQVNASPGPSSAPIRNLPPGARTASEFIVRIGLRDLIPNDKKLDTKNEIRDLQEEVHALTQGVAEFIRDSTDTAHVNGNAIDSMCLQTSALLSHLTKSTQALHKNLLNIRGILSAVAGEPAELGHAIANDALIQSLRDSSYQTAVRLDQVTRALHRIEAAQAAATSDAGSATAAAQ